MTKQTKIKMVLSIQGDSGSVVIKETVPVNVDSILLDSRGGERTYLDIPDLSIYDKDRTITVDIYRIEEEG